MKPTIPRVLTLAGLAAGCFTVHPAAAQSVWSAVVGTAANTNWSTAANWTPGGVPGAATTVTFNDGTEVGDPFTTNNVVDGGAFGGTIASLTYAQTNAMYNNTLIAPGQTLNVTGTGGLTVGQNVTLPTAASPVTTIAGSGGWLNINNSSANLTVNIAEPSTSGTVTLDMSGLGTFSFTGARVLVGVAGQSRSTGKLILALTNTITVTGSSPQIDIGDNSGNNGSGSSINLGQTNAIFADNIAMGRSKQNSGGGGVLQFNAGLAGNNPSAYFRGHDGVSPVTSWSIADGTSGGGTITDRGTSDFSLGTVDAVVSSMWLARNGTGASGGSSQNNATLTMGAGSFTVGNLTNAMLASSRQTPTVNGTINLNGPGTLTVTSNLVMAALNGFTGTANSIINVNGGTLAVDTLMTGGGNATLNVNNATLLVTNSAITATLPLTALTLSAATLQLSVLNGAAPIYATTVTADGNPGDTNIINIAELPVVATYPTALPLIQASSPVNLTGGSFNFSLGSLPGTYQGYLSNDTANSSIDLVITGSQIKADVWNGNLNGNWDTTTANWLYSGSHVTYAPGDPVTFDDTLSGTANVTLAVTLAPGSVTFNNSTHNYVLSGANKITGTAGLLKQGSGTVTLSETGGDDFSGGILVSGGTLILDNAASTISGGLTLNGGTAQIGNNDANGALPSGSIALNDGSTLVFERTDAVTVGAALGGTGAFTQNGSGTVTLTGANTYTGNTTVSQGTLALSGAGSLGASAALAVNNAGFDVSGLASAASVNNLSLADASVTVALNGNPSARITCANLAFSGSTSYINVSAIAPIASYPVTFTIIQSAAPASGANVTLGTLPAASPAYAGSISLSADQTSVLLTLTAGPTSVPAAISWTGSDLPNMNWSDRLNWQLPAVPGPGDNAVFSGVDTQGSSALGVPGGGPSALIPSLADNIVDGNFTIASLTYTNANGAYHNTLINDGATLNITNSLTVGSTTVDFGSATTEGVSISGPNASLSVNNSSSLLYFGLGSPNSGGHQVTLDMSALGTFNASVSRVFLGVGSTSGGISLGRESAVVYLAQTNTIVAGVSVSGTETSDTSASAVAFDVGDNNGNSGNTCYLYLGQTNAIFADAIVTARQKQNAQMLFNPAITAVGRPSAYFRNHSGGTIATWGVADGVANSGTVSPTGVNDFTGGLVDARVGTMYVGRAANNTAGTGTANGTLTFDGGLFDVDTLYAGYQPALITKSGNGTVSVNSNSVAGSGATLRVRNMLNLAVSPSSTASGTLSLNNGVAQIASATFGLNSTITFSGGILVFTNPVGSLVAPLGTLNLTPLGTPDNSATLLSLPVRTNSPAVTVTTLNIDGLSTTTNVINIESVGPVGATPVQLPLIQYSTRSIQGGTFNVGLGTLPSGYAGYLVDDTANSQIALVLTSAIHPQPRITSTSLQGNNLVISGVNGFGNAGFSVLATADLSQPVASWGIAATGVFAPDGSFSVSIPVNGTNAQQFYTLRVQ